MTCALRSVLPLRRLLAAEHPAARKVSSHLLKTAAIILHTRGAGESFQQVLRRSVTAYAGR